MGTLLELLPVRLPEWNRFYHDVVVRQIAYGAAPDRGRTLLELAEVRSKTPPPAAVEGSAMMGLPPRESAAPRMKSICPPMPE